MEKIIECDSCSEIIHGESFTHEWLDGQEFCSQACLDNALDSLDDDDPSYLCLFERESGY